MAALFAGAKAINAGANVIQLVEKTAEPLLKNLLIFLDNSNELLAKKIAEKEAIIQEQLAATYEAHKDSLPEIRAEQEAAKLQKEKEEKEKEEKEKKLAEQNSVGAQLLGVSPLSFLTSKMGTGGGKIRTQKRSRSKKYKSTKYKNKKYKSKKYKKYKSKK